jgi:hypothetical protein
MSANMKLKVECYATIDTSKDQPYVYQDLYRCLAANQVARLGPFGKYVTPHIERKADVASSVEKIGTVKVNLAELVKRDKSKYKKANMDFPRHMGYDVDIFIHMTSLKGVLEAAAQCGRKKLGATSIEYVPDPAWQKRLVHHAEEESTEDAEEGSEESGEESPEVVEGASVVVKQDAEDDEEEKKLFVPE